MIKQKSISGENLEIEKEVYIPGSSEKKRVIMMYFFFGILVYLSKTDITEYEYSHLKQSTWWWIFVIPMLVLSFIPVIKYLSLIALILLLVVWGISVKYARSGKVLSEKANPALVLFAGVGNRFLDLFEIKNRLTNIEKPVSQTSEIEKDIMENDSWDKEKKQ